MDANKILLEAIALNRCVQATYNRMVMKLAPHILYTRHGEVYVDAVTIERDGQKPRETKIGAFKLTGLKDLSLLELPFTANTIFNPMEEKYSSTTLFAVQQGEA